MKPPKATCRTHGSRKGSAPPPRVLALSLASPFKGCETLDKHLNLSCPGNVWLLKWVNNPQPRAHGEAGQERLRRVKGSMPRSRLKVCHLERARKVEALFLLHGRGFLSCEDPKCGETLVTLETAWIDRVSMV